MKNINTKPSKQYLTTVEAAELLLVSPETVRNWTQKGSLRTYFTPGGHRRYFMEDIIRFASSKGIDINDRLGEQPLKVLIVVDKQELEELLVTFIYDHIDAFHIESASNGFAAGQQLYSFKPDVVIIDVGMQGIDGIDACKHIRSISEMHNVVIVAIANGYNQHYTESLVAAGANSCIRKPVKYDELLKALNLGNTKRAIASNVNAG